MSAESLDSGKGNDDDPFEDYFPDPFRGVFDLDPWAGNNRDPATGRVTTPMGPQHVCRQLEDGSFAVGPQIAHRLAWWLSAARLRAQLTQVDIARLMDTTQAAVSKWETGRTTISLTRLATWSDVTRCPVALYFDWGGNPRWRAMWL